MEVYEDKISFVVSLLLMSLGFYLRFKERYQRHPYKLISATILVEAGIYFVVATDTDNLYCYNVQELFHKSIFRFEPISYRDRMWYKDQMYKL